MSDTQILDRFQNLPENPEWTLETTSPLGFDAFHTQGMIKVGDRIFLTAVETIEKPKKSEASEGYDRGVGEGKAWLFVLDTSGNFIDSREIGDGSMYHPGGIDYDGQFLWVPVSEYRPGGQSRVLKISPKSLIIVKEIDFPQDHAGAVFVNVVEEKLHIANWGSRQFYSWTYAESGTKVEIPDQGLQESDNPQTKVDYQDCQSLEDGMALCSGLKNRWPGAAFDAGSIDLVRIGDEGHVTLVEELPVTEKTPSDPKKIMTHNPFFVEPMADGLRIYFIPQDGDDATLYVYTVR